MSKARGPPGARGRRPRRRHGVFHTRQRNGWVDLIGARQGGYDGITEGNAVHPLRRLEGLNSRCANLAPGSADVDIVPRPPAPDLALGQNFLDTDSRSM
jgi:hypothetical protein